MYTWGLNASGRLGHGDDLKRSQPTAVVSLAKDGVEIVQVSCGFFHTALISRDSVLYTCGRGYKGFLGNNRQGNQSTFKPVLPLQEKGIKVIQVCAAKNHTLVLSNY